MSEIDIQLGSSIGVVVHDLDPVLDLYTEGLGLGPFETHEVQAPNAYIPAVPRASQPNSSPASNPDRPTPTPTRMRVATAPLGPCEMELIEVLRGQPPHADFLESEGEGMNHLNLDKGSAEAYLATLSDLYWRG